MSALSIDDIAIRMATVSGVGAINTISNGPDDGANNNLACAFWKEMRHNTTAEAIRNLLSRITDSLAQHNDDDAAILRKGIGQVNIAGHGNSGFLTTGCGQDGQQDYNTNLMATWNEFAWGPELDKIAKKNITVVTIWSCHSGADEEGAEFLYQIAKRVGKPVRGNTGFLYSNSKCEVWMEKGAVWQVATPEKKPDPIKAPSPHFAGDSINSFTKYHQGADGTSIIVRKVSRIVQPGTATEYFIDPKISASLWEAILQSSEFKLPGNHLGYVTHTLDLVSDKTTLGKFEVVNKRIIIGENKETAVYVPAALKPFLE